jgi:hypothetical protein
MRIRFLLASIALALGAGATVGIATASAWTPHMSGEASCTPAPRTATDAWVVTWGIVNATDGPGVITAEHDQHSSDQQLVGQHLAAGAGGTLTVTYPASAASDTLSVTFEWRNDKGKLLDTKTISATVHQPSGCDVYVPPTVPEPVWTAQVCDTAPPGGIATPASYTTTAVTGVHYDVTVDGVLHSSEPAGTHVVTFTDHDVSVYVQAWDDTSGAVIHQWDHTFAYAPCAVMTPPSTPTTPSTPVTTTSTPAGHSTSHTPVHSAPKSTAVVPAARRSSNTTSAAPSSPSTTTAGLAYTGAKAKPAVLLWVALGLVVAGGALSAAAVKYYPGRKQH